MQTMKSPNGRAQTQVRTQVAKIAPRIRGGNVIDQNAAAADAQLDAQSEDTFSTTHDLANEQRTRVSRRGTVPHDARIALAQNDAAAGIADTSSAPELARTYAKVKSMPRRTLTLRKSPALQSRSAS